MGFAVPTIGDFKTRFTRDFPYGTDPNTSILDADITVGLDTAAAFINQDLYPTQAQFTVGSLLLSAHYLVMNLRASSQGVSGQFNFEQQSKSVGSVSESFAIPQRILDNPEYAWLCKTHYGAQYLMTVLPQLTGQVFTAFGDANV